MVTTFDVLNDYFTYSLNADNFENVKTKQYDKGEHTYKIMNYTMNHKFDDDEYNESYYRSVIKDSDDNLMSFSLPQSKSYNYFKENNDIENENIVVSEIIEGIFFEMAKLTISPSLESGNIKSKIAVKNSILLFTTKS